MTTWIVGDVHGCAEELAELVERLALGPDDRLVSVGDLLHRGPDPAGVVEVMRAARARFVLGNHELAILRRVGLAPASADKSERPPLRSEFPPLEPSDLAGDGDTPCLARDGQCEAILGFLQEHDGFWLRGSELDVPSRAEDGRDWCAVHAGLEPGVPPERSSIETLTRIRRLAGGGRPWWYERYDGRELVLFGHTHSAFPRAHRVRGRLASLGLDTGCVYGGRLTAYSPELDEIAAVPAKQRWIAA